MSKTVMETRIHITATITKQLILQYNQEFVLKTTTRTKQRIP